MMDRIMTHLMMRDGGAKNSPNEGSRKNTEMG
jgi:hypothetical protein